MNYEKLFQASRDMVERVTREHQEHMEMYAAAFLKKVGSDNALDYELVQEMRGFEIVWYFRKRPRPHNGMELTEDK